MALSGNQVTRLWPYGGPGHNYGDFDGKTAAPVVVGANAVYVFQWIWSNFERDKKKQ